MRKKEIAGLSQFLQLYVNFVCRHFLSCSIFHIARTCYKLLLLLLLRSYETEDHVRAELHVLCRSLEVPVIKRVLTSENHGFVPCKIRNEKRDIVCYLSQKLLSIVDLENCGGLIQNHTLRYCCSPTIRCFF